MEETVKENSYRLSGDRDRYRLQGASSRSYHLLWGGDGDTAVEEENTRIQVQRDGTGP